MIGRSPITARQTALASGLAAGPLIDDCVGTETGAETERCVSYHRSVNYRQKG